VIGDLSINQLVPLLISRKTLYLSNLAAVKRQEDSILLISICNVVLQYKNYESHFQKFILKKTVANAFMDSQAVVFRYF
jgi:hypothetical protein